MKRFAILAVLPVLGCSGSNEAEKAACARDSVMLKGELDGQPIDLTLALESFGEWLAAGKSAEARFGTGGHLKLTYPDTPAPDVPEPVTGTLLLPGESPVRAGETLCVGDGSTFTAGSSPGLTVTSSFSLVGFASGTACDTPVSGALDGCYSRTFEED